MSAQYDGGPAFPVDSQMLSPDSTKADIKKAQGMSLRDWFAGMALQGLLGCQSSGYEYSEDFKYTAATKEAYGFADAMLAARKK